MNIGQAKEYIKDSVKIYLKKDEYGNYRVPVVKQRPVFLLGAPGLGKTAIMEQVAQELGIALVTYSMTHHTRQSALGLPFIEHKTFDGKEYDVSEYTMSEIIASIYDVMRDSDIREGILFLDEINCVSETLAPSMLQFLQYKVFGRHQVPEGWVIVTAGNPPEYNKSVREFDVVTMDRLKVMEVEADYQAWRLYALKSGVHTAILNYLELKKEDFYQIGMNVKGKSYVTARGWEDLSVILKLYEEEGLKVDETLVGQYLQHERIVKEFTAYYDLFQKYKKTYPVEEILQGTVQKETIEKAGQAGFEERLSLLGMLTDKIQSEIETVMEQSGLLSKLMPMLKAVKAKAENGASAEELMKLLQIQIAGQEKQRDALKTANALSDKESHEFIRIIAFLTEQEKQIRLEPGAEGMTSFGIVKRNFDERVAAMKQETIRIQTRLHQLFVFAEQAFEDGNEMLLLVTELTVNENSSRFIMMFGCEDYSRHNEELMLSERQNDMVAKINALELD